MKAANTTMFILTVLALCACAGNSQQRALAKIDKGYGVIDVIEVGPARLHGDGGKSSLVPDNYRIDVRLDGGDSVAIVQDSIFDLRVGNRVHVVDGRAYRY